MIKRYFSFILALIICISAFSAYAADDDGMDNYKIADVYVPNEKETDYDEIRYAEEIYADLSGSDVHKVGVLNALGIADVFSNNKDFMPDETVTRGQLVALVAKLINSDRYPTDETMWFTDVFADDYYFNEISAAAALGIITGYSDGTFRPDNTISYDEAVSVIMRALGYRVVAEVNGGWSIGYGMTANQVGLTDGISVVNAQCLSRIEAGRLVFNALSCPLFREVTYGARVRYEADKDCTPLSEYHDVYKEKGRVNATFVSAMAGYKVTNSNNILIGDVAYTVDKNQYVDYLGYNAEIYYKDNETTDRKILYLLPDEKVEKLVIKADDITKFDNLTYYYDVRSKVNIKSNHTLIINGVRQTNYNENSFVPQNGEVVLIANNGSDYDTVIINTYHSFLLKKLNTDRDQYVVFESQYNLPSFKIDYFSADMAFVMYMDNRRMDFYADKQDIYNADGMLIHQIVVPDIPADSVLNIFADKYDTILGRKVPAADAKFIKIVISTKKIKGKTSSYNNEEIYIDDGDNTHYHKISNENVLEDNIINYKYDVEGWFLLDYDGRVFGFTTSEGGDQYIMGDDGKKYLVGDTNPEVGLVYGYLIQVGEAGAFNDELEAKILSTDGKVNIYSFADKLTLNGDRLTDITVIKSRLEESAKLIDPKFTISQVIKYQLNNVGEVREIETVMSATTDEKHLTLEHKKAEFNSRYEFGWILWPTTGKMASIPMYNGEARQYFKVPLTETFNDEDYTVPISWWPNNKPKTIEVFDCDDMLIPSVVVQYYEPANYYTYPYVMVKNISKGIDDEGNHVDVLHFVGMAGDPVVDNPYTFEERSRKPGEEEDTLGGEARFFAAREGMFAGLKPGDLIKIKGKNRIVTDWHLILSIDEAKNFDITKLPTIDSVKINNESENLAETDREYRGDGKWDMYEVYSVIDGDKPIIMAQRGIITENSKRNYTQLSPFEGTEGIILYDVSGREPIIKYWDNPHVLDEAREVGNGNASRIYVWEKGIVCKLLVGYIGL